MADQSASPQFSVVVPLYNHSECVARAVASVLAQTYAPFEVIVVDDGSTDGGAKVVRSIRDPRVGLVVQERLGPGAARNRGIAQAKGNWVAFLDADDEWMPTMLDAVRRAIAVNPDADLVFTGYVRDLSVEGTSSQLPRPAPQVLSDYFAHALAGRPMWTGAVSVRTDVLRRGLAFGTPMQRAEDSDLWERLVFREAKVVHVPEAHSIYRTASSKSVTRHLTLEGTTVAWDYFRRRDAYLATRAVPDRLLRSYLQYTDRHLLTCVQKRALEGHRCEAIRCLARYYRGSWLPKRIVAAVASLVMTRGMWMAAKHWVRLGRSPAPA